MTMMHCPNCGHSIPAGSIFCPDCGAHLTEENDSPTSSRLTQTDQADGAQLRRSRRPADTWQRRLIPNVAHLKRVGYFMVNNGWFLLVVYVASLVLNHWRWEIFGLFILINYLFPLLTGKTAFLSPKNQPESNDKPNDQPVSEPEPAARVQSKPRIEPTQNQKVSKRGRFHFASNLEFKTGSILIIPSLIGYLIARQVMTKRGIQTAQIFNQTNLGITADVYFIGLGVLGIATAMVIGGLMKSVIHHQFGGQRLKRWGIITAIVTMLLALAMYQNGVATTATLSVISTIGAVLLPFLPWLAVIFYGLGIVKNLSLIHI